MGSLIKSERVLRAMTHDELVKHALGVQMELKRQLQRPKLHSNVSLHELIEEQHSTKAGDRAARAARNMPLSRFIVLRVVYIGWEHAGFARNQHEQRARNDKSVEYFLLRALIRSGLIDSHLTCDWTRAGRTDAGVSAAGQIVACRVRCPPSGSADYVSMINAQLPDSVRVLYWSPVVGDEPVPFEQAMQQVLRIQELKLQRRKQQNQDEDANDQDEDANDLDDDDNELDLSLDGKTDSETKEGSTVARYSLLPFDARFHAEWRSYKYFFAREKLDVDAMREAAAHFVGRHDFRNFCKMDVANVKTFERVIYDFEVRPVAQGDRRGPDHERPGSALNEGTAGLACMVGKDELWEFYIRGQAFLRNQVRCMAAVLFMVGAGKEEPSIVARMLDVHSPNSVFKDGKPEYRMAGAIPLVLNECGYPESRVSASARECSAKSHRHLVWHFAQQEADLAARLAVLVELTSTLSQTRPESVPQDEAPGGVQQEPLKLLDQNNTKVHIALEKRPRLATYEAQLELHAMKRARRDARREREQMLQLADAQPGSDRALSESEPTNH
ncbi:tRNA pseudouridine(38/39) synthase [Porphyridium purpureum]|uniref:tRNA pseudouridine(38/39) synthase n=1 Tax=Porphyridium purpureum TaxID=35688 RepID=A0A5J4YXQ8_PORPP|nr:tRNA pseudouridine(38/39) synthase [Porphyridium purpureum]|eukprot:POR1841..scf208_2